jgi:hypothetical protein
VTQNTVNYVLGLRAVLVRKNAKKSLGAVLKIILSWSK